MLDRATFLRPIAHRGLHAAAEGMIENTEAAFVAAIEAGYGIECDLQPLADGTPMVFHDETLDRLTNAKGRIDARTYAEIAGVHMRAGSAGIPPFAEFLELVGGRVPLLVEIKSEWTAPKAGFLEAIARLAKGYKGPLALMSFDPAVMARMRELAPAIPRGVVSGVYEGDGWWLDRLSSERAYRSDATCSNADRCKPAFISYHVKALPTPVTRFLREGLEMPLFCWTVRTAADRKVAAKWADAATFEGYVPEVCFRAKCLRDNGAKA